MSEHVRVERDGDVLAITLARPERRNAITVAMYAALADAIEAAAGDDSAPAHHAARRRPGLHRRQRPRRLHGRAAARRVGHPGLAAASGAGEEPGAGGRRGARQCGRASARRCCSTATSSLPRKARAS